MPTPVPTDSDSWIAADSYSADIGRILPARLPVTIADGRLSGAGVSVEFSPDDPPTVLLAYLQLIRRMRNQKRAPAIALRREDILTLARYLDIDGAEVVERLSTLMKLSASQRSTMSMLFATGAIVIGLVAGGHASAAAVTNPSAADDASDVSQRAAIEVSTDPTPEVDRVTSTEPLEAASVSPTAESDGATESAPTPSAPTPTTQTATAATPTPTQAAPTPTTTPTSVPAPAVVGDASTAVAEPSPAAVSGSARLAQTSTELAAITGDGAVAGIARAADTAGLSTATRMQVPVAPPPLTTAAASPPPNQSGCNPDPSGAVMSMVIADIAYACPVYAGGQSMIDAGYVTLVTDAGPNPVLATRPGDPGTLWLAGHRTTHGAAFSQVPNLADGALVTVSSGDATATYRVIGRTYVEVRGGRVIDRSGRTTAEATWASIIRNDFSGNLAPRLVLQTCEGEDFRWMIYADLVTG